LKPFGATYDEPPESMDEVLKEFEEPSVDEESSVNEEPKITQQSIEAIVEGVVEPTVLQEEKIKV
jgi:hypothetical protein